MKRSLIVLLLFAACTTTSSTRSLHDRAVVIDTHADVPWRYANTPFDVTKRNDASVSHIDFPRMKEGGLDAEFFVAYVPAKYAGNGAAAYCLHAMETIHEMVERAPEQAMLATSTSDIERAAHEGKRAILIGIEGGHAIEDSLDVLRSFYRLGARYMTLTHTNANNWADSSKESKHNGLTDFGKEVVLEMNRLGMLVDVSHVSDKTFYDAIATSKAPIIASHSSARALSNVPRNMSDDMLRALAKNGGVVMVNFNPPFLSDAVASASTERNKALAEKMAELEKRYPDEGPAFERERSALLQTITLPPAPWTLIVDHIDHIVKVAGIDHVGLGSDFDGIEETPAGMEDVTQLPKITEELQRRGYAESDIVKILGGNFLRVFKEAEQVSKALQQK